MAIIGISGYAGSGKDTVGRIIQYLQCASVGNLTLEEILKNVDDHNWWLSEQSGWEIKKWAGKLKTIASILTGIEEKNFEDQEFKKTNLGSEWNVLKMKPGKRQDGIFPKKVDMESVPMTVRDFLQKLGTDALRNGLHSNVWVNALMSDYHPTPDKTMDESFKEQFLTGRSQIHYALPNWIITDTRFLNEAQAIKEKGGIMIRVDRPGVIAVNDHPSETELDNYNFDYKILNGSDLVSLMFTVHNILKKEKILQ
jgi:hypothetical protein